MFEDQSVNESVESAGGELPQWAKDKIAEANAEAAKYRVEKREAVEAARAEVEASFTSRLEEMEAQLNEKAADVESGRLEVERLKAALEVGIESSKVFQFADLLKGSNPDELRSHAEELKELFGSKPEKQVYSDSSQGKGGDSLPLNGDPLLQAVLNKIGR